jgi:excisionase family DNA binding protein
MITEGDEMSSVFEEETATVAEAAKLLRMSTSTILRWIDQGALPAIRVGRRRERIRLVASATSMVAALIPRKQAGVTLDLRRLPPLNVKERRRGLAALERAKEIQRRLLERRHGQLFPL